MIYITRLTWLDLAHKRLDEAGFVAYGWKSDLSGEHSWGMLRRDIGEAAYVELGEGKRLGQNI
jgi:hypothetical protein